jgi:hypothetical protein
LRNLANLSLFPQNWVSLEIAVQLRFLITGFCLFLLAQVFFRYISLRKLDYSLRLMRKNSSIFVKVRYTEANNVFDLLIECLELGYLLLRRFLYIKNSTKKFLALIITVFSTKIMSIVLIIILIEGYWC